MLTNRKLFAYDLLIYYSLLTQRKNPRFAFMLQRFYSSFSRQNLSGGWPHRDLPTPNPWTHPIPCNWSSSVFRSPTIHLGGSAEVRASAFIYRIRFAQFPLWTDCIARYGRCTRYDEPGRSSSLLLSSLNAQFFDHPRLWAAVQVNLTSLTTVDV